MKWYKSVKNGSMFPSTKRLSMDFPSHIFGFTQKRCYLCCRELHIVSRQEISISMSESIENKILDKSKKCGRGSVFFVGDFVSYGNRNAVNKALERLTEKGQMLRVARGIYCYPKIEKVYGLGTVPPSLEDIAKAMAKRDGARIVPTGLYAQYQLGLTQQVPMNVVFLTDGASRTINLGEGKNIKFKHASPRYFAIRSQLALLLTMALKDGETENLSEEQIAVIKTKLNENPHLQVADLKLMTSKVREFIVGLYE